MLICFDDDMVPKIFEAVFRLLMFVSAMLACRGDASTAYHYDLPGRRMPYGHRHDNMEWSSRLLKLVERGKQRVFDDCFIGRGWWWRLTRLALGDDGCGTVVAFEGATSAQGSIHRWLFLRAAPHQRLLRISFSLVQVDGLWHFSATVVRVAGLSRCSSGRHNIL